MGNAFAHKARPQASAEGRGVAPPSLSAKTDRLVHDVLHSPGKSLDSETRAYMEPRFRHDFSKVLVHADSNATTLAINKPDDAFELEADRVAERVMRGFEPAGPVGSTYGPVLQRKCACGGICSKCEAERKVNLQRRAASKGEPVTVPPIVHDVLRSPGQPLDAATRAYVEPRFGFDFRKVRIHADERAAKSARAVNALAYTVGHNVVFGDRQFAPSTSEGRSLLVHELTHVTQQGEVSIPDRLTIGPQGDRQEQEAETVAREVTRTPLDRGSLGEVQLQRQTAAGDTSATKGHAQSSSSVPWCTNTPPQECSVCRLPAGGVSWSSGILGPYISVGFHGSASGWQTEDLAQRALTKDPDCLAMRRDSLMKQGVPPK